MIRSRQGQCDWPVSRRAESSIWILPSSIFSRVNPDPRVSLFSSLAAQLGEGAMWHPARHSLFWIDILGHQVLETTPGRSGVITRDVGDRVGAVVPTHDGGVIAALRTGLHRLDLATGRTQPFACPPEHDAAKVRFNDAKCDPRGRMWAGTMALDESAGQGALYRFESTGRSTRVVHPVSISNGLAWSPDHHTLYYIDSPTRAVQAFDYDPATGNLTRGRVAIDLSTTPGFPDGCTIDTEGNLWIAFWDGWCVMRWDPVRARLLDTVRIPVAKVTTCTFGGAAHDTLYITTASCHLTAEERAAQPHAGCVFAAHVGARGFTTDVFAG